LKTAEPWSRCEEDLRELNYPPDEIWKEILETVFGNFQVDVDKDVLRFVDIPANLESRYATVKKAIAETNRVYGEQQKSLIAKLQERDKQQAENAQRSQQTKQQVQKLWDELEL
jgi:hypothetical protein